MHIYQIQIELTEDKIDEFTRALKTYLFEFLREEGCLNYYVYQQFDNKNSFCLIGEFDRHDSMENHFKKNNFGILIGAAGVLGNSFKMKISEMTKTGDLEFAKSLRKNEL
jgi:quinol monooxygenase YgiN